MSEAIPLGPAAFRRSLREAIRRTGKTNEAVAAEISVTGASISNWTRGLHQPRPNHVFAIETACSLRPGSLSWDLGYVPLDYLNEVAARSIARPGAWMGMSVE